MSLERLGRGERVPDDLPQSDSPRGSDVLHNAVPQVVIDLAVEGLYRIGRDMIAAECALADDPTADYFIHGHVTTRRNL